MSDTRTIDQMAVDAFEKLMAEHEAARRPATPTPEQQLAERLSKARFRDLITEHALLHGVIPQAVRYAVREAEEVFELQEGALVPRDGATDPNDPLSPLTPARWLQCLASTDAYFFMTSGRTH